eukprot:1193845-Prorocentrum_minimum.AAC.1
MCLRVLVEKADANRLRNHFRSRGNRWRHRIDRFVESSALSDSVSLSETEKVIFPCPFCLPKTTRRQSTKTEKAFSPGTRLFIFPLYPLSRVLLCSCAGNGTGRGAPNPPERPPLITSDTDGSDPLHEPTPLTGVRTRLAR